jgi:hypothetical protein
LLMHHFSSKIMKQSSLVQIFPLKSLSEMAVPK